MSTLNRQPAGLGVPQLVEVERYVEGLAERRFAQAVGGGQPQERP
jgi:hypothetical protein